MILVDWNSGCRDLLWVGLLLGWHDQGSGRGGWPKYFESGYGWYDVYEMGEIERGG